MGIGFSIFLLAIGAILTFAVESSPDALNLNMIGVVLMVTGGVWFLLTMLRQQRAGWHRRRVRVIDEDTGIEEKRLEGEPPTL
jgi:hypothetical protein